MDNDAVQHPVLFVVVRSPYRREGEMKVSELAEQTKTSIGNLSQHLGMMKQRHILASRKEGNMVYYRLSDTRMLKAFDILREILFDQIRRNGVLIEEIQKEQH
ncbi:MAG: ArsR family transcriptional regulator [Candidatus Desantisbacteria bacterium]